MITAGEVIKRKRESLGKDLSSISIDTKIQRRFLEYIESNQFDKFDSQIFATGFLKIYSKYLGLDVEKILALYRRSKLEEVKKNEKKIVLTKKKFIPNILISPKILAIFSLFLFLALIVGYVGYQIYKFQTPPNITIIEPTDEYVTKESSVLLKGLTETSVQVQIGDTQIDVNSKGEFQKEISLNEGLNSISVKARKISNSSLETIKTVKVIYAPENAVEQTDLNVFLLSLSISQSPSWIKLDIDDENKISQVLPANTIHEFEVKNKFTLVTGRVQNTKLTVNEEEIQFKTPNSTGISQITCNIVNNQLECQ